MTAERWRLTEEILVAAWDAPPETREALLASRCAGDRALLEDVRALIEAQQQADNWIAPTGQVPADEMAGRRAGPYRLERLIGRGGMGAVYLAHRADESFDQKVAIKLIGLPFALEPFRERFRRERQILAGLSHPNITRLLDGGVTPDGELYLVMEYVDGVPLDEYCRSHELSEADRLRLFRVVSGAVQYAHQNLIVHRDIKPSNILVSPDGAPKLLDFGTAKLLTGEPALDDNTRTGLGLMTAAYASPEQLRGEPASTLSDVYSLGALLYELLSGERAFGNDILSRLQPDREPNLPKELGGDRGRIVHKALAADPAQRYVSVEQLSEDVRRYLDREPVIAHPPAFAYRASKFVRRHIWSIAAGVLFTMGLACSTALSFWQASVARRQAERAEHINAFLNNMLGSPNPSWYNTLRTKGKNVTVLEVLNELRGRIGPELSSRPDVEVELRRTVGRMYFSLGQHKESREQLEIALRKQLTLTQPNHPDTGLLYKDLAYADFLTRRNDEALRNARSAVAILSGNGRKQDRQATLEAYDVLALALAATGRPLDEAETPLRQALAISREVFGNGGSTPVLLGTLSTFAVQQGKFEEAVRLANEGLRLFRERPGPAPAESFTPLRNLGVECMERLDYACAEKNFRASLATAESNYGSDNLYSMNVRAYLALALGLSGRVPEAERELNRYVEKARALGGSTDLTLGMAAEFLGRVQMTAGKPKLAEGNLRKALTVYRQNRTPEDIRTAVAASRLGECLLALNKRDEAMPLLTASYRRISKAFAPDHPWVVQARQRLANASN